MTTRKRYLIPETADSPRGTVYLIHFSAAISHAQHYIGWTQQGTDERLAEHQAGRGGRLPAVAAERGITLALARTWPDVTKGFERRLKNQANGRKMCPLCKEARRGHA